MSKKIKPPTAKEYAKAEKDIVYARAPEIYPCAHCKWPVELGFCCGYCGSTNPRSKADDRN